MELTNVLPWRSDVLLMSVIYNPSLWGTWLYIVNDVNDWSNHIHWTFLLWYRLFWQIEDHTTHIYIYNIHCVNWLIWWYRLVVMLSQIHQISSSLTIYPWYRCFFRPRDGRKVKSSRITRAYFDPVQFAQPPGLVVGLNALDEFDM